MPPPDDRDKTQPSTLEPHVITLRIEGAGHAVEPRARIDRQHMTDPNVPPVVQLLVDMRRETNESISGLHTKVDKLAENISDVRDEHADLRERVAKVETKVETNDKRDAEERAAAFASGGTGRYPAVSAEGRPPQSSSPIIATPTPAIAFNIGANAGGDLRIGQQPAQEVTPRRHSLAPPSVVAWFAKIVQSRVVHVMALACAAIGGGFAHHLLSPPAMAPEVRYVTVPAPQPVVADVPVVVAPPVVTPATTVPLPDAGRPIHGR
jgi:hypothetical protein